LPGGISWVVPGLPIKEGGKKAAARAGYRGVSKTGVRHKGVGKNLGSWILEEAGPSSSFIIGGHNKGDSEPEVISYLAR